MKYGFFGALANNTYVAAKSFSNQGHSVVYIKDLSDEFPFSQPVWEDAEFVLDYELISTAKWNAELWAKKESELGWEAPQFVKSPAQSQSQQLKIQVGNRLERFFKDLWFSRRKHLERVLKCMQQADVWIVCGIQATLCARASGKPYVIWPHGGDIRFASGIGFSWRNLFGRAIMVELERWLLRKAYKNALFVGTHDPSGIGGHARNVKFDVEYFPLPMPARARVKDQADKEQALLALFLNYDIFIPKNKIYVFVPSRIDFYWKGTDRLISAIIKVNPKNIHFIFSGWGQDYLNAKEQLANHEITFLPFAMSKAFLFNVYANVSLVVDQFLFSTYGTSAVEAMSVGTPVMMHIDEQLFIAKDWPPPPVINVQSIEDISSVLRQIDETDFPLDEYARKAAHWFQRTHDEIISVPRVVDEIHEAMSSGEHA